MRSKTFCVLAALAAVVVAAPAASAEPTDPVQANAVTDGPYLSIGSYGMVCADDNLVAQTAGVSTGQCAALPAPAAASYTDTIYCKAVGAEGFDSNGRTFWQYEVSGYISTNDSRATRGSVTCRLNPSGASVTNAGPLPGTVTVATTLEIAAKQSSILACGWITYLYNNRSYIRYVGNC